MSSPLKSTDKKQCFRWLEYYLESELHCNWKFDEQKSRHIYQVSKNKSLTNEEADELVQAIRLDIIHEKCCVGPEFTLTVATLFKTADEPYNVPDDWFVEAAIRDLLIERNLDVRCESLCCACN